MSPYKQESVVLIGAGPVGLEMAIALKQAGVAYIHFEKGQIAHTITGFPPEMQFFSSADRIAIAGVPIPLTTGAKCTREEYLAYLRAIVVQFDLIIHSYEEVRRITKDEDGMFTLTTLRRDRTMSYRAGTIIFATGDIHAAKALCIPGEELPHVSHRLEETHKYFQQHVLVVGGKNSAVEAALRCHYAGARVAISYRGAAFSPSSVKYWLLPDIDNRIAAGEIVAYFETTPEIIASTHVTLRRTDGTETLELPADFVLLMTGYTCDNTLLKELGVQLAEDSQAPFFSHETMETNVSGVFVCGTVTAGNQQSYKVFIENCHEHAQRIIAALKGEAPPPEQRRIGVPET